MIKSLCSLVLLGVGLSLAAQDSVSPSKQVVLTINKKPVYVDEFETVFKKNNENPDTSPEALDEYMELFVKYKLKVAEAEALGMDTVSSFIRELSGYRSQLAAPYLSDAEAEEKLVRESYENLKYEIDASHILIRTGTKELVTDTLEAYEKALKIKKQIENGADFGFVAAAQSQDPSAKSNKGNLGYFSGMQMVWPFEQAAFNAKVGDVVGPVKTKFGFHIIKIHDRRPTMGTVKVAHILINSNEDSTLAKQKIEELYQMLQEGANFEELAKKYSDDKNNASKGGELPVFGSGRMVESFEEAAFALENPGEYSKPVKTRFGYHIIKLIEKYGVPEYEDIKPAIAARIKKDGRSEIAKESFVNKLKKEYGYKKNERNYKRFYKWVDNRVFEGTWELPKASSTRYIASWADTGITELAFAEHINNLQRKAPKEDIVYFVDFVYAEFEHNQILNYEDRQLENKYPEFAALMKEYRDGILLFDLMNKKVWNKAVKDTTGLKIYFQNNLEDFQWKERAEAVVFKSEDKKLLSKVAKKLSKGMKTEEVLAKYAADNTLTITTEDVLAEKGENEILNLFEWKMGVSGIKEHNQRYTLVNIEKIIPAGAKTLDEARGAAIAAYQNHLEQEWIKELTNKYSVEINREVLYSVE